MQGGVRAMEVIVVKIVREEGGSMIAGGVRTSISPLSGDGLNEALSFAVGLGAIRFGEEVFEAELVAGSSEEFGAIG